MSVGRTIVDGLVERGLDVLDASVVCRGEDDERVLSLAAAAGRIVITNDWRVGEMTVRHGRPAIGVIILSLYSLSAGVRERIAIEKIVEIADQAPGHLMIIEPARVRKRPLAVE